MGKFGLQFKATLENITNVRPVGDDFRWYLKLKCGNCGEVSDKWQYITLLDSMPLKGGQGSASMVQKCKLCSRENSIGNQTTSYIFSIDILRDTITPYNAEDSERYKTIVQFECRGLEPVDFQPQAGFAASGAETSTQFPEINLQEKDWTDYDEKASESVGIYEVTHQFIKC
uniref:CXXC motif containing zinc binding protein n=2 Tax=Cyprinus carpio TaxID=7962 RepID=A0A9J7X8V1_CYPCA